MPPKYTGQMTEAELEEYLRYLEQDKDRLSEAELDEHLRRMEENYYISKEKKEK